MVTRALLCGAVVLAGCFEQIESEACGPESPCEDGRHCIAGQCELEPVRDDIGPQDLGFFAQDQPRLPDPDMATPDVAQPEDAASDVEQVPPDAAADAPVADTAVAEATVTDGAMPDVAAELVDVLAPDAEPPEMCDADAPFDGAGRPCVDQDTLALWRFDDPRFPAESGFAPNNPPPKLEQRHADHLPEGGRFAGGVSFRGDGDQRIKYGGLGNVHPPFTIEAWVRPARFEGARQVIISTMRADANDWRGGWEFSVVPIGENQVFSVRFGWSDGTERRVASAFTSRRTIPNLTWSHVAVQVPRDAPVKLWVNGQPEEGEVVDIAEVQWTTTIGNRAERVDGPFHGVLDEIRLTDGVRPDAQIIRGAMPR